MASSAQPGFRTTGSTALHPLSQLLHLSLDQVNFVVCQLIALVTAVWFRVYLSPCHAHTAVRHAFATVIGAYFVIFCFGWYSLHMFTMVLLCYYIMVKASIANVHRYSFVVAMGYLILCQVNRVYIFNYGILSTDFSGPLMILTQKITTLAFQVHDGMAKNFEMLSREQKQYCVKKKPTFLEYLSYHLNFMSVLAGPCSHFKDYVAFIEGNHIQTKLKDINSKANGHHIPPNPSPTGTVLSKLCFSFLMIVLFFTVTKHFPLSRIIDDTFINETPLIQRLLYLYIAIQACKPKYYFAWTLSDAVNNAAGYGFSGVDGNGNYRWDLITNLNIRNVEAATSFKMYIDNWNIQTAAWLKRICYDRAPRYRSSLTFLLSALWHGLYPGYYLTFLTGIPVMMAARVVRSNFRHFFVSSKSLKLLYDIVTWIATQLAICYTVTPFLLLAVEPSIKFYRSVYFYFHIGLLLVFVLLSSKSSQKHMSKQNDVHTTNHVKKN